MITVNSYFCGAGLMDIGLMQAGINIGQAFELDPDACIAIFKNMSEDQAKRDSCTNQAWNCGRKFRQLL